MRLLVLLLCAVELAAADEIDPQIYADLFIMNTKPLFDLMARKVKENVPKGGSVLDLGSGPGEPTVTLARIAPDVRVVCTDFQAHMNDKARARAKAASLTNVDFAVTSADDLSAWQEEQFDAIMMSLVLMFVPDKAKSLREVARVLKPGGSAYIAVWTEQEFYEVVHAAMEKVASKTLPPFAINPLKLKARNAVEDLATAAGLELLPPEDLTYAFKFGTPKETADVGTILAGEMLKQMETDGDAGAKARFYSIIEKMVQERGWVHDGDVSIPGNTAHLAMVRKPFKDEL